MRAAGQVILGAPPPRLTETTSGQRASSSAIDRRRSDGTGQAPPNPLKVQVRGKVGAVPGDRLLGWRGKTGVYRIISRMIIAASCITSAGSHANAEVSASRSHFEQAGSLTTVLTVDLPLICNMGVRPLS